MTSSTATPATTKRYKVLDSPGLEHEIQELSFGVDSNNVVTLGWKWPADSSYKMAVIFEAEDAGDTLEDLLKTQPEPVIATKGMGKCYQKPMNADKKIFKIFPARFGEGSEIIVINQKESNVTPVLLKKIRADYAFKYQPVMFGDYQKVTVSAKLYDEVMPPALIYEKYSNSRMVLRYPLHNVSDGSFFYIKKSESIKVKVLEPYTDIIEIKIT